MHAQAAARSTPLPAYAPDSTRPSTHGAQATHAPTPLASRQAADLAAAPPSSNQSRPAHQPAQPRQQTSSRPAPQPEPQAQAALLMPSYREATSKQAPPLVASPEQGHRRADDWQRPPLGGVRDRRQPSPAAAATDDGYGYDVEPVPRVSMPCMLVGQLGPVLVLCCAGCMPRQWTIACRSLQGLLLVPSPRSPAGEYSL